MTTHAHKASMWRAWVRALFCLGTVLLCGWSHAQSPAAPSNDPAVWWTVGDQKLSEMRGGFDLGTGLFVSFGISRAVYINNQLITATSLQIDKLDQLTPMKVAELVQQLSSQNQVVQSGPGNTVDAGALTVPLATYIQNTLNDQLLRTETRIQASTNGLSLLKEMNLHDTINEAVNRAIGLR